MTCVVLPKRWSRSAPGSTTSGVWSEAPRRHVVRLRKQETAGRGEPCRPGLRFGDETRAPKAETRELVGEAQAVDDEHSADSRGGLAPTGRDSAQDRAIPVIQRRGRIHLCFPFDRSLTGGSR
jgi:hypothetical protein